MANFRDLLQKVKAEIDEITAERIKDRLQSGRRAAPSSTSASRTRSRTGSIPGAAHLSRAHFESRVEDVLPDKDAEVVVYCAGGVRSVFAAKTLQELGYTNVASMIGRLHPLEGPRLRLRDPQDPHAPINGTGTRAT